MIKPLLFLFALSVTAQVTACPWCKRYGLTPTVTAEEQNAGGLYFGEPPPPDKTRHYYIAAEPELWTWVPERKDRSRERMPLPPYLEANPVSAKLRYVEYVDGTFTQRVLETPRMGLTGPVLRGLTGEYLAVTFRNNTGKPLSMHPHGVRYDKDSEGAYAEPGPGKGSAVGPRATFTYVWHLDALSGPQPEEPSSKCWLYHSHCKNEEEVNQGLAGFIIVTDPARARPDGTPVDVDREMPLLFYNFDETPEDEGVEYAGTDLEKLVPLRPPLRTLELRETAMRPAINGRMFANLPGLDMREGERVRWYLAGLGEDDGMHTVHWHGARLRHEGRRVTDVVSVLPGETSVADQLADVPGSWLVHCHVGDHMMEGMLAHFTVLPRAGAVPSMAFPGMRVARQSLVWTEAAVVLEPEANFRVSLRGRAGIYRGYFPRNQPPTLLLGGREILLKTTGPDTAAADGAQWKIEGANAEGVVLLNEAQFSLTLEGPSWRQAFAAAGVAGDADVKIELRMAGKEHSTALPLRTGLENGTLKASLRTQ